MKKIILAIMLMPIYVMGQVPRQEANSYVSDYAHVLSADQKLELNRIIKAIDTSTTVQIAIVLVDRIPEGTTIEDYALQIGREWGVGNGGNGIVYVAAIAEHSQRLEIGMHMEGSITDVEAREMTGNIKPYFREQDYFGGLKNLLSEIKTEIDAGEQKAYTKEAKADKDNYTWIWLVMIMLAAFGIFVVFYFWSDRKEKRRQAEWDAEEAERQRHITEVYFAASAAAPSTPPTPSKSSSDSSSSNYYSGGSSSSSSSSSSDNDSFGNFGGGGGGSFGGGGSTDNW